MRTKNKGSFFVFSLRSGKLVEHGSKTGYFDKIDPILEYSIYILQTHIFHKLKNNTIEW